MMKKKCATVFGWILHLCSKIYSITPQAIHITSELHRLWIIYQHSFKGKILAGEWENGYDEESRRAEGENKRTPADDLD